MNENYEDFYNDNNYDNLNEDLLSNDENYFHEEEEDDSKESNESSDGYLFYGEAEESISDLVKYPQSDGHTPSVESKKIRCGELDFFAQKYFEAKNDAERNERTRLIYDFVTSSDMSYFVVGCQSYALANMKCVSYRKFTPSDIESTISKTIDNTLKKFNPDRLGHKGIKSSYHNYFRSALCKNFSAVLKEKYGRDEKEISLETVVSPSDSRPIKLGDRIPERESYSPTSYLKQQVCREVVMKLTEVLTPQERAVLYLSKGLNNEVPMTQAEVAEFLGISQPHVCNLLDNILEKLQDAATSDYYCLVCND